MKYFFSYSCLGDLNERQRCPDGTKNWLFAATIQRIDRPGTSSTFLEATQVSKPLPGCLIDCKKVIDKEPF